MNIISLYEQVPYNQSRRFDCPECRGKNSLSVTKEKGRVSYNCFKAHCKLSGSRAVQMSHTEAKNVLALRNPLEARTEVKKPFVIPDYWIQGLASKKCFQMLLNHNALEAYQLGLLKIAYDPRQDRLVYLIQNKIGAVVGAVGRTLSNGFPKALNYNSSSVPFTCGHGDTLVLVEDCASACSIGRFKDYTGLALLGTQLKPDYLFYIITNYSKVIIALDNDATYKSLKIRKLLEYYIQDITVWKLNKDLKNMNHTEVLNYINKPIKDSCIII